MTGFFTKPPWPSARVSVPRPSSATEIEPSGWTVTTACPPPVLSASSAA
ncbi:hypothetical protein ABT256_23845 [Amycolatopsis japonica]